MSNTGPLKTLDDLIQAGWLDGQAARDMRDLADRYAISVTPEMAGAITQSDPADPIYRQFIPSPEEYVDDPRDRSDPIGDELHSPMPGIVHRHQDRVLFKVISACPVYCRFCFRREMIGPGRGGLSAAQAAAALNYIHEHPEIWEVIFTGGDPFMLSSRRLAYFVDALETADHVRLLRWHTRVPVVDPGRVTPELIDALLVGSKTVTVLLHTNHVAELTGAARMAIATLIEAGLVVRSQTVLLKGVNAEARILGDLFRALTELRVTPYYLHHPDWARGTSHFRLSLTEGAQIVRELRERYSGIVQPQYVVDIPGGVAKVPVDLEYVDNAGGEATYRGKRHPLD